MSAVCSPCLSRGWLDQVPAAAAAAAAWPCCGGVVCWDCPAPCSAPAPAAGLAPQPRKPCRRQICLDLPKIFSAMFTAAAGEPLLVPELATVVPGPPGATVAGKEVGVGKPPCSA